MRKRKKVQDVKKIYAQTREVLQHEVGDYVLAGASKKREVSGSCKIFTASEQRAERENQTPPGKRSGLAQKINCWLCSIELLAQVQKSEISGSRRIPRPNSLVKLEEEKEVQAELPTDRRRHYTDLG